MNVTELTMPLSHRWMPDEVLPTSVKFFLGPRDHHEKGMVFGSDTGTCLMLPSVFADFRKSVRIDDLPLEKLVLRPTTIASITKSEGEQINPSDIKKALDSTPPSRGDALLFRTGWGDKSYHELEGGSYILQSPHLSLEAAQYLGERMKQNESDLLLVDTALFGRPDKFLIREWCSLLPTPSVESAEARMYLHLYTAEKAKQDFAVELELARCGIMMVRKLINCSRIRDERVRIIVAPLKIVRGVASTCRVVAVEYEQ